MQRHVDIYRHKVIMGIHKKQRNQRDRGNSRDPLMSATVADLDTGERESQLSMTNLSANDLEMNQEIPIDDPSQVVLHKEMFVGADNEMLDVRTSQDFVDFAFAESGRISDSRQLTVQNKHSFSVDVDWALLDVMNRTTGQWVKNPFRIRPESAKIEANSQMTFNVEFAPFEPDQYFFQVAQCFVTLNNGAVSKNKRLIAQEEQKAAKMKMNKSGTMSKSKTLLGSMKRSKYDDAINEEIDPPICLSVRLVGHSFPPGS
jgi:hypothetical protein